MRKILKDQSEYLESNPLVIDDIFRSGVVTSVEYRVQTPATPYPADGAWSTGSYDTVSTLVQGAHVEGSTHVDTSTSQTWVRGRYYAIDNFDGAIQLVQCNRSATSARLYIRTPLTRSVATSASVLGITTRAPLSATDTATVGPGAIQWRATVEGHVVSWTDAFVVVRHSCDIPLTVTDLLQIYPAFGRYRETDQQPELLIEAAWSQIVLPRLAAKGISEEDIVNSEPLKPVLAQATLLLSLRQREDVDTTFLDDVKTELGALFENVTARRDWVEGPQTANPPTTKDPLTSRVAVIRVTR